MTSENLITLFSKKAKKFDLIYTYKGGMSVCLSVFLFGFGAQTSGWIPTKFGMGHPPCSVSRVFGKTWLWYAPVNFFCSFIRGFQNVLIMVVRPHEVNKHQALKNGQVHVGFCNQGLSSTDNNIMCINPPCYCVKKYKNSFLEMTLVEEVVCLCHIISRGRWMKKITVM